MSALIAVSYSLSMLSGNLGSCQSHSCAQWDTGTVCALLSQQNKLPGLVHCRLMKLFTSLQGPKDIMNSVELGHNCFTRQVY